MVAEVERGHLGPPRAGSLEDLDALRALDAECFEEPWSAASWRGELTAPDRIWLVVPADGRGADGGPTLAAGGGVWLAPDAAHVLRLGVASAWRRFGIADQLVVALVAAAERVGRPALTLEVRASNRAARSLYRRHGFATHGRRPRYYPDGEDAVVLWRHGPPAGGPSERR